MKFSIMWFFLSRCNTFRRSSVSCNGNTFTEVSFILMKTAFASKGTSFVGFFQHSVREQKLLLFVLRHELVGHEILRLKAVSFMHVCCPNGFLLSLNLPAGARHPNFLFMQGFTQFCSVVLGLGVQSTHAFLDSLLNNRSHTDLPTDLCIGFAIIIQLGSRK